MARLPSLAAGPPFYLRGNGVGCSGSDERMTEMDFVRASVDRQPGQCLGPLLGLWFEWSRLDILADVSLGSRAYDRLRDGFEQTVSDQEIMFSLFSQCAAHWFDLAMLVGLGARLNEHPSWASEAATLVHQTCTNAGWDVKEISNLLHWQRAQVDPG